MYYILESENGQPFILWRTANIIQKYTIRSGHIYNKGIMLKDINKDFQIWNIGTYYISYESVDGSHVVSQIDCNKNNEVFITKSPCTIVIHYHRIIIFFLESYQNHYRLCATISDNFKIKKTLFEIRKYCSTLHATTYNEQIILFLNDWQYILSEDLKLMNSLQISKKNQSFCTIQSHSSAMQNEISRLNYELIQSRQEYEKLSEYTGKLQEKLRKLQINL